MDAHCKAAYQQTDVLTSTTMPQKAQVPTPSAATGVHTSELQHSPRPDQEPRLGDPCKEAVNKTRDILRRVYKTTGSYVLLLSGGNNDQMYVADTKVQLNTREGAAVVTAGDILNSTEYAKILTQLTRAGELIKHLIFFGLGGVGKSTIFDRIAYDWADETNEILRRFKLVFLLKMYALVQESDLVDSTFDQLLCKDSGVAKDELDQFILANPNEVLILLDGFDEMKTKTLDPASFGSVLEALNRTVYKECCICVSTRPSHLETLMSVSLVQNPCTHVEVLGFMAEDITKYIQKFCGKDTDSGNALIQSIEKSNMLRDLAKNPMLLNQICLLWREIKQLPKTTSCLFTEVVDHMFARKNFLVEEKSRTLIAIGETALRGLTSADQKLSFQEDEFEPKELELALKAGILTKQSVLQKNTSHNNIQFMHKTIQEYCAAKYLQGLTVSTLGLLTRVKNKFIYRMFLSRLCSTIEAVVSNEFLIRFCGDNGRCRVDIVKLLDRKFRKDEPRYQSSLIQAIICNCVFESQSANVPQCTCVSNYKLVPSTVEVVGNSDFRSLIYLLEIICRSDIHLTQLASVLTISVSRVSSVSDLAFALGYMENLRDLRFRGCPRVKGGLEKILSALKCSRHLTSLCLVKHCAMRAEEWAPHLKYLTSLKKLELRCCQLRERDIKHMASAAGNLPKLTDLILADNQTLGGAADWWAKELPQMRHLNKLDLSECYLAHPDFEHITAAVGSMPNLTDLILAGNFWLGELAELWAKEWPKMTHLNRLDLRGCDLTPTDFEYIASAVGNLPRLTDLILVGNRKLGGSAELWAKELLKMMHLNRLNLSCCDMTPIDFEHIASAVGDMPSLTDLYLGGNQELAGLDKLNSTLPSLKVHMEIHFKSRPH